jgi:allantoin racemase
VKEMTKPNRILVINPIVSDRFEEFDKDFFNRNAHPLFEVEVTNLTYGPASIESYYDDSLAAPFVVQKILDAEKRGFKASIINCFMDPGLDAAREVVSIPVVGAGESAICLAPLVGDRFSIIDPGPARYVSRNPSKRVRSMGVEVRFASSRGVGISVLEIDRDLDATTRRIGDEALKAVKEDGADTIVLGCTGFAGLAPKVQAIIGTPVIDPGLAALKAAETLCQLNLHQSKIAFPKPPEKLRKIQFLQ